MSLLVFSCSISLVYSMSLRGLSGLLVPLSTLKEPSENFINKIICLGAKRLLKEIYCSFLQEEMGH